MIRINKKKIIRLYLLIALLVILISITMGYRAVHNESDIQDTTPKPVISANITIDKLESSRLFFSNYSVISAFLDSRNTKKIDTANYQDNIDTPSDIQPASDGSVKKDASGEQYTSTGQNTEWEKDSTAGQGNMQKMVIKVYFADSQAQYIDYELRVIEGNSKTEYIIAAFKELLKGPNRADLLNLLPADIKINGATCKDDYASLDLSSEFVENREANELIDFFNINCIAATITSITEIEGTIFTINGEKIEKYGSIDVSKPVKKDDNLIAGFENENKY